MKKNPFLATPFKNSSSLTASNVPESPIDQWIVVTTPHNFKDRIDGMKDFLGLTNRTINKVAATFEADTCFQIDDMNMAHYANKIPHVKEVIIVHSKADKIIPIESARIAHQHITQSELIKLEDLEHYAILWSDKLQKLRELMHDLVTKVPSVRLGIDLRRKSRYAIYVTGLFIF
ncbi:MAG: pimeloyl-ACP methyl ester carboxylesterase [Spirosomataceae bacterium]|jgi:pimeloyl-ACP methyl ester carboxylesterase